MRDLGRWVVLVIAALGGGSVAAGVRIDIDRQTLSEIVSAVAPTAVDVPIAGGATLRVELRGIRVTALEPATPEQPRDGIRTALRLVAPEIGLDAAVAPRLSLGLADEGGEPMLELRFDEVPLAVPLVGRLDLARFVAPLRYPAQNVFSLPSGTGEVDLVSRLAKIGMTRDALRLDFEITAP